MEPVAEHRDVERERWDIFQSIPRLDRAALPHDTVKGSQVLEPLFEFSGACGGCGDARVPRDQPPLVLHQRREFGDDAEGRAEGLLERRPDVVERDRVTRPCPGGHGDADRSG